MQALFEVTVEEERWVSHPILRNFLTSRLRHRTARGWLYTLLCRYEINQDTFPVSDRVGSARLVGSISMLDHL